MSKAIIGEPASFRLSFGKHKGKTLGDLLEVDPSYILWLSEHLILIISPALVNKAKKAVEEIKAAQDDKWAEAFDPSDFY